MLAIDEQTEEVQVAEFDGEDRSPDEGAERVAEALDLVNGGDGLSHWNVSQRRWIDGFDVRGHDELVERGCANAQEGGGRNECGAREGQENVVVEDPLLPFGDPDVGSDSSTDDGKDTKGNRDGFIGNDGDHDCRGTVAQAG